jgi:endonuclease/exonuclease/phosphatase family metal-dependent hydrolase
VNGARSVTVGTFNIHHGVGTDGCLDIARTADTLRGMDVDVVGLQEVDRCWSQRSAFDDQARGLAEHLDMHMVFGASLHRARRGSEQPGREYGVALLSRHPIVGTRHLPLPRPRGGEPRTLLQAEVLVGGVRLRCLNTHLQHRSGTERRAQARAIEAVVADGGGPTVLVGDLNAGPDTAEVATLTRRLVDAWRRRGEGEGYTFTAEKPHTRIDYVLASPTTHVERIRVLATDASDHLPVVADLRLPGVVGAP